jgi:DNA modification methylase
MGVQIITGDCLEVLRTLADCSVDSVVTDPPYGLSFMGKRWDYDVPGVDVWAECLRVLKPGGHLLAFAGTRTQHRMAVRIEDAGFEIRDMIAWVYGSGFPKSLDVSKAIDKAAGAEREVVGVDPMRAARLVNQMGDYSTEAGWSAGNRSADITAPATEAVHQWQGWGTALKPALEPITVARKPLIGTVASNVLAHGTGGLNIDGCRVPTDENLNGGAYAKDGGRSESQSLHGGSGMNQPGKTTGKEYAQPSGRWPANLIHDGSEEVVACFPVTGKSTGGGKRNGDKFGGGFAPSGEHSIGYGDTGSAARFFYCAKASKRDRDEGLEDVEAVKTNDGRAVDADNAYQRGASLRKNSHPTVKPTDLMRYLCRLVTPPGGVVLDPFMGSGSTGKAAVLEGFRFVGIEREAEYVEIARARIASAQAGAEKAAEPRRQPDLFGEVK